MEIKQILARTSAGRRFIGFMRTVNKGDETEIRELVNSAIVDEALQAHGPDVWTAQLQYIHMMSGGLKALRVVAEDEYRVIVLMQAHNDQQMHVIDMAVEEDHPHRVMQFVQRLAED